MLFPPGLLQSACPKYSLSLDLDNLGLSDPYSLHMVPMMRTTITGKFRRKNNAAWLPLQRSAFPLPRVSSGLDLHTFGTFAQIDLMIPALQISIPAPPPRPSKAIPLSPSRTPVATPPASPHRTPHRTQRCRVPPPHDPFAWETKRLVDRNWVPVRA